MKKALFMMFAAAATLLSFAKEIEQVTVVENESVTITAPFAVKNYSPSNKDVVRIELLGGAALRVTGLKRGRCDLDVMGENNLAQKYEISCVGDLASVLEVLTMDLDSVPEVRAEIRGNNIRIDGEVTSIQKWEYLMKVVTSYGNVIKNFAKFSPGPEIVLHLKNTLEQAGFAVQFKPFAKDRQTWPYNTVALDINKMTRVLSVQARCFSEAQLTVIKSILNSQDWLAFTPGDSWQEKAELSAEKRPYAFRTLCTVFVDRKVIRLSVAYMAIGESDMRNIGNPNAVQGNGVLGLNGVFGVLRDLVSGETQSKTATIGASLDVTSRFLKQNQISRVSDTGYTLLSSWDPKGANFKSGGTRYVKITGHDVADMKEIPYGFTINAKGGLVDEKTMNADLDICISSLMFVEGDGSYDRKEDLTKQQLSLPIGRTTLIGGFSDLIDKNTPPSGLPVLRNTPIINWFVADSGKSVSDRRLVMMVCPEIVDNTQDAKPDVDKVINIPVQEQGSKDTDEVLEERKRFHGFWYWLNWFTF